MRTTTDESEIAQNNLAANPLVDKEPGERVEVVKKVKTRFGELELNANAAIFFKHGVLGFPSKMNFCIVDFPDDTISNQFKLLQSIDDEDVTFIVVPADRDNSLIDEKDTQEACTVLDIDKEALLYLFIVTTHETDEGRRLSVNARAPIMVDIINKTADQFVFQNKKYQVQHMIS